MKNMLCAERGQLYVQHFRLCNDHGIGYTKSWDLPSAWGGQREARNSRGVQGCHLKVKHQGGSFTYSKYLTHATHPLQLIRKEGINYLHASNKPWT